MVSTLEALEAFWIERLVEELEVFGELGLEAVGREFAQKEDTSSMFVLVSHGHPFEDGKGQQHQSDGNAFVENVRVPCKKGRSDVLGLRRDKNLRDANPEGWRLSFLCEGKIVFVEFSCTRHTSCVDIHLLKAQFKTTTTTQRGVYPKRAHFSLCVTCHDGPQLAARRRSCPAAKAATTALVVATREAADRCGPGHVPAPLSPTGTDDGQGRGGGSRGACTVYYTLGDDEEVLAVSV